jgi:hypothetical protein
LVVQADVSSQDADRAVQLLDRRRLLRAPARAVRQESCRFGK